MSDLISSTGTGPPGALARPEWRAGEKLTASALNLEHAWRAQRLRRHLRLVHGWGVVCGLNVVSANDDWYLFICPGYGISPCGDEIFVSRRYRFNLRDFLWTRPLASFSTGHAWIALEAADESDGERSSPCCFRCGCSDHGQEASASPRIADGFRVTVSWTPPGTFSTGFDLCSGATPSCPVCPETCGLMLASVRLPLTFSGGLVESAIHNLI